MTTESYRSESLPDSPMQWPPEWVDFHCHSTASDGQLSPTELLDRAKQRGLKVLAITDHDTVAGYRSIRHQADEYGLKLISGIEFSCVWGGQTIHIVGLNMDIDHPQMVEAEALQQQRRVDRGKLIAERVGKKLRHTFDMNALYELAGGDALGRPHFAQYMVDRGLVPSMAIAFKKYLGAGKVGDVKAMWPRLAEVTQWITNAGGTAVFAHAHHYKMTKTKLRACLTDFIEAGGVGLEVAYGQMDPNQRRDILLLAQQFNLVGSRGSDFHRPAQHGVDLGVATPFPKDIEPVWHRWV